MYIRLSIKQICFRYASGGDYAQRQSINLARMAGALELNLRFLREGVTLFAVDYT